MEVWVDGGIRRGSDVVKALALGADAVLIGRAYLWGLAANGTAGVENVLDIIGSKSQIAFHDLPQDDPKQRRPDISLAQEKLEDWAPRTPLREGLTKTIEYFDGLPDIPDKRGHRGFGLIVWYSDPGRRVSGRLLARSLRMSAR